MGLCRHTNIVGQKSKARGKFKVQNPKFKQSPKFKPMNRMQQESHNLSFGVDTFV